MIDGEQIGLLVSVGARATYFTTCSDIGQLDGRTSRSSDDARTAVATALHSAIKRQRVAPSASQAPAT